MPLDPSLTPKVGEIIAFMAVICCYHGLRAIMLHTFGGLGTGYARGEENNTQEVRTRWSRVEGCRAL